MREKNRKTPFYSAFLILVLIAFAMCNVQGSQLAQTRTQTPQLIPPPPSEPYWTYKTNSYLRAVAVSEDGNTVVAGSYDGTLYVFGRQSNTTLWTYKTSGYILSVAVSANGSTIVEGGYDHYVRVFARTSNTTIWSYNATEFIRSVAVSADGSTIVAGGNDNYTTVFGRQSNTTIWRYHTPNKIVRSVAVSADGNTIVAGGNNSYVRVFGRQSNTTIWNYNVTGDLSYSVAVSADGNTIAAGGSDGYVHVFGRQSNATIWNYLTSGSNLVVGVAVSRDGTTIATGGLDKYLRVFGRTSNVTLIQHFTSGFIYRAVAVSSDGSTIACGSAGSSNPRAFVYSKSLGLLASFNVSSAIDSNLYPGPAVGISGDGSLIAYGCDDGKLHVFQYDTTPPVLGAPSVVPYNPVGGQNVNISISATDNIEVSTVNLHYRNTSSGSWRTAVMSLTGVAYKATIGPFSSGDIVSYYITASDATGNTASTPADSPLSYYVFTVGNPPPVTATTTTGTTAPAGIQWTSVLLGAGLGAAIAIIVSVVLLRGKKSRR